MPLTTNVLLVGCNLEAAFATVCRRIELPAESDIGGEFGSNYPFGLARTQRIATLDSSGRRLPSRHACRSSRAGEVSW